jgi:CIC family chloride channel protein
MAQLHSPARLGRWLDRLHPSEPLILGGAALLVGLLSGAGIWAFKELIDLAHKAAFVWQGGGPERAAGWPVALVPIAGGLLAGGLVKLFVGEERHHGVAGIMEAVALAGGRLRYGRMPAKAAVAAISIGCGASVGPEDPSVQIGSNLGSMLGQWLHLSDERVRGLVAAGAAGGIAAAFNAPIAGVFFAVEVILGELGASVVGVVTLAAVISAVFTQAVAGPQPAFDVPAYAFGSAWELPLYLGLGLLAGPVAALYVRLLYLAQDSFRRLAVPHWLKPAIAGAAVGAVGVFLPQVLGVGYDTIEQTLGARPPAFWLLVAILAAKLVVTPVSIGGGFLGGVFAPALFLGAMLGGAYGILAEQLFPALQITVPGFAMVGMAAVLAGAVHAPLTAILLLFEMTNDYRIILPLMFAVVISLVISRRLQPDSVYEVGLARKGIRLQRGRDVEVLEGIAVGEAMVTDMATLRESDSLLDATEKLMETRHHGLVVVDDAGDLAGILSLQDLERAGGEARSSLTVGDVCTRQVLVAYPDETIGTAMRRMGTRDIGRLPVVDRAHPRRLLGVLRRADVVRIYDVALTRRAAMRNRAQQVRLGAYGGLGVEEIALDSRSVCTGKRVREVRWPRDAVIATVRRGHQALIPHGDTLLKEGDVLVVVAEGSAPDEIRKMLRPQTEGSE